MKHLLFALSLACALIVPCSAQNAAPAADSDVPAIVSNGFASYKSDGADGAVGVWIKGSPLEMSGNARTNLYNVLANAQPYYGTYTGWEPVKVVKLSASTRIVYAVAKLQKGPVWMSFSCFNTGNGWVIATMVFDTDPVKVLPEQMRSGM